MEPVSFAYVDVVDRSLATDEVVFYRLNYATFPHRKALGWMGFVPAEVAPAQLPLAAQLVPVAGKGTVIVAVDAPFDLNDPAHIRRANQVEMDMVDLGLLPVTDPNYR
ncbi:immunity 52 family protein [Xanthomonas sp. AmX2]|nr:immunity 52 family protein [Xanthomonas sp.]